MNRDNGKWLLDVMELKQIYDKDDQEAILYAMIHEFNEMLIQLAHYKGFTNLYHIDCRGAAGLNSKGWFDELHLTSNKYERVSQTFIECIQSASKNKVFKVRKDLEFSLQ